MYDQKKNKKIPSDVYAYMRELLEEEGLTEYSNLNIEFFAKYGHLSDAMAKAIKKGEFMTFYDFMSERLTGEAHQALEYFKEFFISNTNSLGLSESLRDWFKKEKWVRITTSGNIAGPCGTSKNKKNPDRCLPKAKAQSLSKAERAATARKKKKAGSKGKTVVPNTKKAKVTREQISELVADVILEKDDRCTRIAKRKYDTWPSAYASGAVVRCRRGEIWKDLKETLTTEVKATCCGRCGRAHIPENQGGRGCKKPYLSKNSPQHCKNK